MKLFFSFLIAISGTCGAFTGAADEGIVANKSIHPYFAPPGLFHGKAFWNNVGMDRFQKEMVNIAKEPMTKSGYGKVAMPILYSFFENPPPDNTRLMIREIELYSGEKNVAPFAKVQGETAKGEIRYAERVNDGDDSRFGISYSAPALIKQNQPGSYTFTFDKPVTISSAIIKSGHERPGADRSYIHLAADFSIQVKDGNGKWTDIPGTVVKGNSEPSKRVDFSSVTVSEIRVDITGQRALMKRSVKAFTKYPTPENLPFQIATMINRPPFNCFEDSQLPQEELDCYLKWRDEHPNFLGFYIGEWDNDFLIIYWNRDRIGNFTTRYSVSPAVMSKLKMIASDMQTREGFMKALKFYFDSVAESCFRDTARLNMIDCVLSLSHYAQEWGSKNIIMETTCNGYQRHQAQMYFTRGSARQYGNPWSWYIAPTLLSKRGYTDPDYIGKWSLGQAGGKGGFSPSMNMRDRYLAWFAGASSVFNEVWPFAYCMDKDNDGIWELSPHGEVMKEWFSFITANPERGVSYAPVAIGMQWDHGVSAINGSKPFADFPIYRGDMMNEAVFRTLMGYKFGLKDQEWGMSETPYGDICDVILPAPPSGPVSMNVLKNYRVLFLCGTFNPNRDLAERLKEYVREGGTLAVNVKQLGKFLGTDFTGIKATGENKEVKGPVLEAGGKVAFDLKKAYDFEKVELYGARVLLTDSRGDVMISLHKYGKGNVIITTPDHLVHRMNVPMLNPFYSIWPRDIRFPFMDWLFGNFSNELLPVKINGHIQYGINILDDGILVYLFNNEGVSKTAFTEQKLDKSKKETVKIDLKELNVSDAVELRSGKKLSIAGDHSLTVTVPAGDIAVIKLNCGRLK